MKEKWDSIDSIIKNSFEEIEVSDDYNLKLNDRIRQYDKRYNLLETKRIAALSFIVAGFMLLVLNTSSLNYKITNMKTYIKTNMSMMQYNSIGGINIENIFLGE